MQVTKVVEQVIENIKWLVLAATSLADFTCADMAH